jgi:ferredoxin
MAKYKIKVKEHCIACNACVSTHEENFEMNEDNTIAVVKKDVISEEELEKNEEAKDVCPTESIVIEKVED